MNKELLYVLVSGGEAKIHCILFYCTELKNNHCRLQKSALSELFPELI